MTGFARAGAKGKASGWMIELRSLNHRYFEFSLKVPPSLYALEDRIREHCQRSICRGKVTVNITEASNGGHEDVALDEKVLKFYLSSIRKMKKQLRLEGSLSVSDILTLPRIFSVEKKSVAPEKIWVTLKPSLDSALKQLMASREKEGKVLAKDLLERITKIEKALFRIEARAKDIPKEHYERLRERIQDLFDKKFSENDRVWQEAVLIAEKADVTEETVRLKSHLQLFREKIAKADEVGKELDFILQEINREINTLGVKSQNVEISRDVVLVKAELEKIREQTQNIE